MARTEGAGGGHYTDFFSIGMSRSGIHHRKKFRNKCNSSGRKRYYLYNIDDTNGETLFTTKIVSKK